MSQYKLGRLAPKPVLGLGDLTHYLTAPLPAPPPSVAAPDLDYPMAANDRYGDCVAEGTLVAGSVVNGGYRAPYSGPMVCLKFASGKELTVTPNHAVLTPRGFVRARFLHKGDYALGTGGTKMSRVILDGYLDQTPTPIEDVVATLSGRRATATAGTKPGQMMGAVDFHGDERFVNGYVEVVWADGLLKREISKATLRDPHRQKRVGHAGKLQSGFHRARATFKGLLAGGSAALRGVSVGCEGLPLFQGHSGIAKADSFADGALLEPGFSQQIKEPTLTDTSFASEFDGPLTGNVTLKERSHVGSAPAITERVGLRARSQFVASVAQPAPDGAATDADLAADLFRCFPGVIEADEVVDVDVISYTGHVYDLSVSDHWYISNGIITHNCTIAGALHADQATAALTKEPWTYPGDTAVINEYLKLTGGQDTGLVETNVLTVWQQQGLFGKKLAAWAPINVKHTQVLKQTVALCGVAYTGILVPEPAQTQFANGEPWDLTGTSADHDIEGGHAVPCVGYNAIGPVFVTWGALQQATWRWLAVYLEEAYATITAEVKARGVLRGLNFSALEADLPLLKAG